MIIYNLYQYMLVSFAVMNLYNVYIKKKNVHITYQNSFFKKFSMIIYNFLSYFLFLKGR